MDVSVKDGVKACRQHSGLIVVNVIELSEAFCNVADFVASDVACIIIMLAFADNFPF